MGGYITNKFLDPLILAGLSILLWGVGTGNGPKDGSAIPLAASLSALDGVFLLPHLDLIERVVGDEEGDECYSFLSLDGDSDT